MRVSIEVGADGRPPKESADPVVILIDGPWTAIARHVPPVDTMPAHIRALAAIQEPGVFRQVEQLHREALVTVQRGNAAPHITRGYLFPAGWRCSVDHLPIPKSARALARRALRRLPTTT